MKRVLICGASGFIGRNLFEALSKRQDLEVYGTYLTNKEFNHWPPNPRLWRVDFTNRHTAQTLTKGFDYVINAAAKTDGSGAVFSRPESYIGDNIAINSNLAEAAYLNQVEHFIFLSCSTMYPSSDYPLKEDEANLNKIHPKYFMGARMKVFAEDLCNFYSGLGKTKYTILRHSNIYGPYDKFDLKRGHVFAATITKVMESTDGKITIWGQGDERRDFLHVNDLISFIELVIEEANYRNNIFNVGDGRTFSVRDLVNKIIKHSGKEIVPEFDPSKPSIETCISLHTHKAMNTFNWSPQIDIDQGIRQTIDWYLKNKKEA